jgi:hypothetical protein
LQKSPDCRWKETPCNLRPQELRWDHYDLAARLEKLGDRLMTACEKGEEIEYRVAVCNQAGAVCRIVMTLKALRIEARGAEPEPGIAGSAVRKYAAEFAARHQGTSAESAAEAASDSFIDGPCWTDPADE